MKPVELKPKTFNYKQGGQFPSEYGTYLIIRYDGKCHLETWNGTGWAYNHKSIEYFYLPKIY